MTDNASVGDDVNPGGVSHPFVDQPQKATTEPSGMRVGSSPTSFLLHFVARDERKALGYRPRNISADDNFRKANYREISEFRELIKIRPH